MHTVTEKPKKKGEEYRNTPLALMLASVHSFNYFSPVKSIGSSVYSFLHSHHEQPTALRRMFENIIKVEKIDVAKEANRKYRRTVYTASDWKIHRSSKRYVHQLLSMPNSYVLRGLSNQVFIVTLNAFLIVLYNTIVEMKNWNLPILRCSALPFSLTSSALGLLLVFRTNAAYSRWKDARVAWATITSKCSNLIRQAGWWFPEKDRTLKSDLFRYVVAYAQCLKWKLRHPNSESRLRDILGTVLSEPEIDDIASSQHRLQRVATKLSDILRRANLLPNVQCHVDKGICDMVDAACVCERIYTTPIPLVYTRHTARFLFIWLLTVPMSLYHELRNKWAVIPISFLNAILLFGIEELGVQIEEPFSILALDEICEDIQSIAREAQGAIVPATATAATVPNPDTLPPATPTTTTTVVPPTAVTSTAALPTTNSSQSSVTSTTNITLSGVISITNTTQPIVISTTNTSQSGVISTQPVIISVTNITKPSVVSTTNITQQQVVDPMPIAAIPVQTSSVQTTVTQPKIVWAPAVAAMPPNVSAAVSAPIVANIVVATSPSVSPPPPPPVIPPSPSNPSPAPTLPPIVSLAAAAAIIP
eukprot:gene11243-23509_t